MEFDKVINLRHSVRSFESKAVPKNVIKKIISDGCKAPSSANKQPWQFVVVTKYKRDLIAETAHKYFQRNIKKVELSKKLLSSVKPFYKNLGDAPVIILIYMDKNIKYKKTMRLSIAAATENIILTAVNEGLGTCWMGTFNSISRSINKIIQTDKELVSGIILGYPSKNFKPLKRTKKKLSDVLTFV